MTDYSFDAEPATPASQPTPEPAAAHDRLRADQGDAADVDAPLLDYVKVLYKRRWTAIAVFALILGTVVVYSFTATPIFAARTRLLIEAENQNVVSFKAVLDAGTTSAYVMAGIAAVNTVIAAAYYMRVLRVIWMDDAPDGDVTPIRTPAPIAAALVMTAFGTIVLGVLPNLVARFGNLPDLTGALSP